MTLTEPSKSYFELISWLHSRRDVILATWRKAVRVDDKQEIARSLSRSQLNDHIPEVLNDFERSLARLARSGSEGEMENAPGSSSHGLHRWQQGYELHELTKEWGHLHLCLLEELETYAFSNPNLPPEIMHNSRRVLAELCIEGVSNSTARYFDLHQREAEGHVHDLEEAIRELNELERRRAELWRGAAHDLRGSVAVVTSASTLVNRSGGSSRAQEQFQEVLRRSVSSLQRMLSSVIDFARLQAGHEHAVISPFDASELMNSVGESFKLIAEERGLYFFLEGPETLNVEGDAQKVTRIAQNIILNAIKYTEKGGITVAWEKVQTDAKEPKWSFSVTDTGPGVLAGPGSPLTTVMKEATDLVREAKGETPPPAPPARPAHQTAGEGIGLSIVKGLCNLLNATIELQASEGGGTVFRIVIPADYKLHE